MTLHTRDPRFDFSDEDIREAVEHNRLLSMEIEFTRACNYLCSYCYAVDPDAVHREQELTRAEIVSALEQAAALGARKIVILGGEPLLYEHLEDMLEKIASLGMVAEIFTNGSLADPEMCAMLFRHRCRVIVKLNTLKPDLHDKLTGVRNSLEASKSALHNLRAAGYDHLPDMLGATTVLSSVNIAEAPAIRELLRQNDLLPYFECITPQGRLLEHLALLPTPQQLKETFDKLLEIDRRYGYDWEPQPPLVGQKCFRHTYSCVVKSNGDVVPCVGLDIAIGNVRATPLRQILAESKIVQHLKEYRKFIKAPCRNCEKFDHCYGCRGTAYQMTGDYLASDPTCWLNADKLDQIIFLPTSAEQLLPHGKPMSIVDELSTVGDRTATSKSTVRPDNPFVDANGVLHREGFIEYAAQTAAALDSFEKAGKTSPGLLIEVQDFHFHADAKTGDEIRVSLRKDYEFGIWNGVSFRVTVNGRPTADGVLKLCIYNQ